MQPGDLRGVGGCDVDVIVRPGDLDEGLHDGAVGHRFQGRGKRRQSCFIGSEQMPVDVGSGAVSTARAQEPHHIAWLCGCRPWPREPFGAVHHEIDRHFAGHRVDPSHRVRPQNRLLTWLELLPDPVEVERFGIPDALRREQELDVHVGVVHRCELFEPGTAEIHPHHVRGELFGPLHRHGVELLGHALVPLIAFEPTVPER